MTEFITAQEKIKVVEDMIELLRAYRNEPGTEQNRTWHVLKAVASDLRAQLASAPNAAVRSLEFHVESARKQKARIGFIEMGNHQAVSESLISFWPTVRRALVQANGTEKQQGD